MPAASSTMTATPAGAARQSNPASRSGGASSSAPPTNWRTSPRCFRPAELARAARFGTDALRQRWMAGRGALRTVLGRTLGIDPAEVAIVRGARGRPELAEHAARIDFNVSHTRGVALVAVARDVAGAVRVGVDIEHRDREVGADRLARKFLTASRAGDARGPAARPSPAALSALLDVQGSDEQGHRRRSHRADEAARRRPRARAAPARRAAALLTARLVAAFADVPAEWLATVALWRAAS